MVLEDVTRFRLLDEVKSNLVATVSHELKTPLTSIRLVLHLLLEENAGPLAPKQLELLVDARDNAERLLAMINNLLDLARLEQGRSQLHLRPEQPIAMLQTAADRSGPGLLIRAWNCRWTCPRPAAGGRGCGPVPARDAEPAGQRPGPHAPRRPDHPGPRTSRRQGSSLSVTDTGSGIPAQYLPLLFEKYFRVPGDTAPGGSGLGLAIVREIATAHGGTVNVRVSGKGLSFVCVARVG